MSKLPAAVGRPRPDRIVAAADLSGGASDWNTLAVVAEAADEGGPYLNCLVMEGWNCKRSGLTLDQVVALMAGVLAKHGITVLYTDRYAGSWPQQIFKQHGIRIEHPIVKRRVVDPGSANDNRTGATTHVEETYLDLTACVTELRPWVQRRRITLPPNPELRRELKALESRARSASKMTVGHPPGFDMHDDHVAALAIAVGMLTATANLLPRPWGGSVSPAGGHDGGLPATYRSTWPTARPRPPSPWGRLLGGR